MERPIFDHFITTWFNVRFADHERGLDPDWLAHRFELFERFCYPSMRGQTRQNFHWLVFFDPETPEPYRSRIDEYATWSCFHPVFVPWWTYDIMRETMRSLRTPGAEYVITTRMDNDDALARDYVETLQAQFAGQEFEFINFVNGLVWHRGRVYAQRHRSSSFANLIERADPADPSRLRTVLSIDHMSIAGSGKVRQLETPASWMLVVHDQNLMNRPSGVRCSREVLSRFSLPPDVTSGEENRVERALERWAGLLRAGLGRLLWRVRHGDRKERLIGR